MSEIPRIGSQPALPPTPEIEDAESKDATAPTEEPKIPAMAQDIYQPASPQVQKVIDKMPTQITDFEQLRASRKLREAGIDKQLESKASDSAQDAAAAKVVQNKTESPQGSTYVVQKGDTVSKIANQQGVTVRDIVTANPGLKDPDKIYPGQELVIPPSSTRAQTGQTSTTTAPQASAELTGPKTPDLDGAGRVTRGPALPLTVDYTSDPAFKALPPDKQAKLLDPKNDPEYVNLDRRTKYQEKYINGPEFSRLTAKDQNNIRKEFEANRAELQKLKDAPPQGLQKVVNHELYAKLTTEQKTKLLNIYATSDEKGKAGLPTLMNRQVNVESGSGMAPQQIPALLSRDNREGKTLLDHLDRFANQDLHPDAVSRRGLILGRMVEETAQPTWLTTQGRAASCAETSVQTHLLLHSPAEYVRILGGLTGPDRKVTLSNGDIMTAAKNDLTPQLKVPGVRGTPVLDGRTVSSRIFQTAVVQYARKEPFDPKKEEGGLTDEQGVAAFKGVSNRDFDFKALPQIPSRPGDSAARRELFDEMKKKVDAGNVPIEVGISRAKDSAHSVLVTEIRDGRVYFRNPWGSAAVRGDYTYGKRVAGYPSKVADPDSGIESMTIQQFRSHMFSMIYKRT